MVKTQKTKGLITLKRKTAESHLISLIKEFELAIALSNAFSPGQSKQLKASILKLVKHLPPT